MIVLLGGIFYRMAGRAIIFEAGGLRYDPTISTKTLAPWIEHPDKGMNGDPKYFLDTLLPLCQPFKPYSIDGAQQ